MFRMILHDKSKLNTIRKSLKASAALVLVTVILLTGIPIHAAAAENEPGESAALTMQTDGMAALDFYSSDNDEQTDTPIFGDASVDSLPGREVLSSYVFLSYGGYESCTLRLTESIELSAEDSLSVYPIDGYSLCDDPIAAGVHFTGEASFPTDGLQGFALVREYAHEDASYQTTDAITVGDGSSVSVEGYLPEGCTVEVTPQKCADDALCAYDITIRRSDGSEFQPYAGCPLKVTIENEKIRRALQHSADLEISHIGHDDAVEPVKLVSSGNAAVFEAESFSTYIIREHEGEDPLVTPRRFYHFLNYEYEEIGPGEYRSDHFIFRNMADEETSVQIIKSGDALEKIPIPPNKTDRYFYGWYVVDVQEVDGDYVTYQWTDNPERVVFGVSMSFDDTYDSDIYLAPIYSNYRFVTFHENEADQPNGSNVLTRKLIALGDDDQTDVTVSDVRAQPPDAQRIVFWGWSYHDVPKQTVRNDGSEIPASFTITSADGDAHFYPVFKQARWLTFDTGGSGSGAKYVPAQFVVQGDSVTNLPVSERTGYSFGGWYTAAEGGVQVTNASGAIVSGSHDLGEGNRISGGQLTLEENLVLHARWTEIATADYTVIYWKQKSDDPKHAADSEKKYDYDTSEIHTGSSGTAITNLFNNKRYTGFTYRTTTVSNGGVIKSDGTTVVNVYYDRDLMVINFYFKTTDTYPEGAVSSYTYTATTSNTTTPQYGVVDGEYVQLTRNQQNTYSYTHRYRYTVSSSTRSSNYYIVEDQQYISRYLYYNNGRWYKSKSGGKYSDEYTGQRYSRSSDGSTVYTGQRYVKSGDTFTLSGNTDSTMYGLVGGVYVELTRGSQTASYWWSYNGEEYTGIRYTRSSNSGFGAMLTWSGLYGSTLAENGYDWNSIAGYVWNESSSGSGTTQTMLDAFIRTENPYNLYSKGQNGTNFIYHYKQNVDGSYSLESRIGARTTNTSGTFNFSNKFDGFTVSTYSTASEGFLPGGGSHSAAAGTSASVTYPIHIYHTRNKYSVTLEYNYIGCPVPYVVENIPYGAKISDYVRSNAAYYKPERAHYEFLGWYKADTGSPGDPPDFDMNMSMPSCNMVAYAHWDPIWYHIEIDPNGAELDHINGTDHGATYFWLSYGTPIGEYQGLSREYVPDDDGEYVYMNITFHGENNGYGINANLRNALYIPYRADGDYHAEYNKSYAGYTFASSGMSYADFLSCISAQRYRKAHANETYTLLGWYRVYDNGVVASTPYSFSDEVETNVKLRAIWRRSEVYYVAYNPVMTGTNAAGTIAQTIDPDPNAAGTLHGRYTDQATAIALMAPTDITEGYLFEGWRIVDGSGNPLQDGVTYDPGEEYRIDAQYADGDGCIRMEAYYVWDEDAYRRRVSIASLILNANGGKVNSQNLIPGDTHIYADIMTDELFFDKQPNNTDIRLADYIDNFAHPAGYFLLGWNTTPDPGDYLPEYAADAVIGIDKLGDNRLYAVWEPTVYLTIENHTEGTITSSLSFIDYTGTAQQYTGRINEITGDYEREPFSSSIITLAPEETIRLALPDGVNAGYVVSGVYSGSKDFLYAYSTDNPVSVTQKNHSYSITGRLFESPIGTKVSFYDEDTHIPAPTGFSDTAKRVLPLFLLSGTVLLFMGISLFRRRVIRPSDKSRGCTLLDRLFARSARTQSPRRDHTQSESIPSDCYAAASAQKSKCLKGEFLMKKMVKRTLSVLVVVLMITAMAIPAIGAVGIGTGAVTDGSTTLTIPKGITVKNTTDGNYYGPNVTYTYTIAPIAPVPGAVVEDDNDNDFPVEIGVTGGATLANAGNVVFTSSLISNVTPGGVETINNLVVNVDLTKFTKPGVYRYVINDVTETSTLYAAGIVRPDDYDTDRYLDIYIKNGSNGVEVAGYTLTTSNLVDTSAAKDSGFVSGAETAFGTDVYRTYNIRIEKKVTGDMGDKTHQFPFVVNIDNNSKTYYYGTDSNAVTTASDASSQSVSLKHGDVFYIRGLSPRAQIAITETNDTADTYKVTVQGRTNIESDTWDTLTAATSVEANGSASLAQGYVSTYVTANSNDSVATEGTLTNYRDVRFINDLASVSPTGVVLRFAPFVLLIGFAVVFLMISRKTKASKKETGEI